MRFRAYIILILAALGLMAMASVLNCYHSSSYSAADNSQTDELSSRVSGPRGENVQWDRRTLPRERIPQFQERSPAPIIVHPGPVEEQTIHYGVRPIQVNGDSSLDFEWAPFAMALVMLVGGNDGLPTHIQKRRAAGESARANSSAIAFGAGIGANVLAPRLRPNEPASGKVLPALRVAAGQNVIDQSELSRRIPRK